MCKHVLVMMLGLDGQGWMSEKDAGGMQRGMLGKLASGKANEADICGDLEKKMVLSSHVHLIERLRKRVCALYGATDTRRVHRLK